MQKKANPQQGKKNTETKSNRKWWGTNSVWESKAKQSKKKITQLYNKQSISMKAAAVAADTSRHWNKRKICGKQHSAWHREWSRICILLCNIYLMKISNVPWNCIKIKRKRFRIDCFMRWMLANDDNDAISIIMLLSNGFLTF